MELVEFRKVKKNRYGHLFLEEPVERIHFRERCKDRDKFGGCKKHCKCFVADNPKGVIDAVLFGCTPGVDCPRLKRWDTIHGLQRGTYTIVENETYYSDKQKAWFNSLSEDEQLRLMTEFPWYVNDIFNT